PVEPNGRACNCGARGCLEQYASATGIVKSIVERRKAGTPGSLDTVAAENLTTHEIAAAARAGDNQARAAFAEAGERLGQVVAGAVNLLNPDGVVITGGVSASFDLMEGAVRKELEDRCFERSLNKLQLRCGELGDKAGILGAALLSSND
ncbi:MAG: ROK family protein, partial [Desulfuromonadales bacterium]|nr:ROK family protein [Desulfuromonadales bacterium]